MSIYIYTHKDFDLPVHNKDYKILTEKKLNNNYDIDIIDVTQNNDTIIFGAAYGELKGLFYLYENNIQDKYVGLVHYRRYFDFMDNTSEIENLIKDDKTIIVRKREDGCNLHDNFKGCHNPKDWEYICDVIKELYPQCAKSVEETKNINYFYTCNMFIMSNTSFMKYAKWLKTIFDEFNNRLGLNNYQDVYNHEYLERGNFYNYNPIYQARAHGFIAERIMNIYIHEYFDNIIEIGYNDFK